MFIADKPIFFSLSWIFVQGEVLRFDAIRFVMGYSIEHEIDGSFPNATSEGAHDNWYLTCRQCALKEQWLRLRTLAGA